MTSPRLVESSTPTDPDAAVLVLHGGASRRERMMVSPTQLSVLRMIPVARRIVGAGRGRLAVFRLLNSSRGWDAHHTPVDDVRWALAEVAERYSADLPVGLVGHSLGGRAALLAGDAPPVRSVVALNPWVYPSDAADLTGRRVLIVHGRDDRIADPRRAMTVARTLSQTALSLGFVSVEGGKHAMLRRGRVFERAAADFVVATVGGQSVDGPVGQVLAGEDHVSV